MVPIFSLLLAITFAWSRKAASCAAYLALSERDAPRQRQYRGLFDAALDPRLIDEIRSATRNGFALGAARIPRGRPSTKLGTDPIFK